MQGLTEEGPFPALSWVCVGSCDLASCMGIDKAPSWREDEAVVVLEAPALS